MGWFSDLLQRFNDARREARIQNLADDMRWLMKQGRFSEAHQVASIRHNEMNARSPQQRARMAAAEQKRAKQRAAERTHQAP